VLAPIDVAARATAVARQLHAETDAESEAGTAEPGGDLDADLRDRLAAARPAIVSPELITAASRIAVAVGAEGLRADLMLCRAAAAHAGWDGRAVAGEDDLRRVAALVLAHRRRRDPFDAPGLSADELDHVLDDALAHDGAESTDDERGADRADDDEPEEVEPPDRTGRAPVLPSSKVGASSPGRDDRSLGGRGRYLRDRPADASSTSIAAVPTAVAAVTRRAAEIDTSDTLVAADLREAVREERVGRLVVLVVDTSGSMGAQRRIAAAKGVAIDLLTDAYQRRNRVALVVFRGERAEVVMRPTGSVEVARTRLADLPTGGTTPLADALETALDVGLAGRRDHYEPILVLITDGRATVGGDDPVAAARAAAARVAAARVPAIVVDAEDDGTRLGLAREIARAMNAEWFPLAQIDDGRLERELQRDAKGTLGSR
jgi:magnesium chelatase subunit D